MKTPVLPCGVSGASCPSLGRPCQAPALWVGGGSRSPERPEPADGAPPSCAGVGGRRRPRSERGPRFAACDSPLKTPETRLPLPSPAEGASRPQPGAEPLNPKVPRATCGRCIVLSSRRNIRVYVCSKYVHVPPPPTRLDLVPINRSVGLKAKPTKPVTEVLRPVVAKYGLHLNELVARLVSGGVGGLVAVFPGRHAPCLLVGVGCGTGVGGREWVAASGTPHMPVCDRRRRGDAEALWASVL